MNKTAMMQLIASLENGLSEATHESTKILLNAIIERCKAELPTEKQQIVDAYRMGWVERNEETDGTSEQYYSTTYNTNQ